MIVKKPYAFLIKNFRIIHAIIFVLLLFLIIKNVNLYSFFSGYASNNYYIKEANLADNYVSTFMYLSCIIVMIVSMIVYYLLEIKNKGNKIYMFMSLYVFILLIYYIYMHSVLYNLEAGSLSIESVRALRDISVIALLPGPIFMFVAVARALGFNLRQFDFKSDLEGLEIDQSDSEEIEVTLSDNSYKVKRTLRKIYRLTKYFFLENKIFVIGVASVVVIVLSISIFNKINIYSQSYAQNQSLQANAVWYNVIETYITNTDVKNNIIMKDKYYILVKTNIINKYNNKYEIDRNTFKLKVNDDLISPVYSLSDKFIDLGITFSPFQISAGEERTNLVVFEINQEDIKSEYLFKIKDAGFSQNNKLKYKDIIVNPIDINDKKDEGTYKLPSELKFDDSILKSSKLIIGSYEISSKFQEKYKYKTSDGKEHSATYSILPNNDKRNDTIIIRFKSSYVSDSSSYVSKIIKNTSNLLEYYGIIRYRYLGEYKTAKLTKMNLDFESDTYTYMEIPYEVSLANKIDLIVLIRGIKYTIILK